MALLSVLTPVLALVLCLVVGFLFLKSRAPETSPRGADQPKDPSEKDFRPWVDQDLHDDTEITTGGGGPIMLEC
ncbi:hypothetical protein CHARACLAT_012693 [Characodon lateralis]|uniref:Uncharacterized protein n=1 Tax=Characodon lateralis TaxID=208331 RepID=A0ABU7E982_9TELE|nr:hypothetical protein [Characodon lateralis]